MKRKIKYWGRLKESKVFSPSMEYYLLDPEDRKRFIWPEDWDLSMIKALPSERGPGRPPCCTGEASCKLYGHVWLLEQMAKECGLAADLVCAFHGNEEKALDVLTLGMCLFLEKKAFSHVATIQKGTRYPAVHELTPGRVTRLLQSITEDNQEILFECRRKRLPKKSKLAALDSSSRSGYGKCLATLKYGHSKDHLPLPQTAELVVYSLDAHQPIFYRSYSGNTPDCRTLEGVLKDLHDAGFRDLIIVTDRGYECWENIELCVRRHQALITAADLESRRILDAIREMGDFELDPRGAMNWLPEWDLYARQCKLDIEVEGLQKGKTVKSDRLHLNLYFDPRRKVEELVALERALMKESALIEEWKTEKKILTSEDLKRISLHTIVLYKTKKTVRSWSRNEKKIESMKEKHGFFAIITLGVSYTPSDTLTQYRYRDEQEKYYTDMKTVLDADRQLSSDDRALRGRRFVEFVALILVCAVREVWRNSKKLREALHYMFAIFEEMKSIHYIEHTGHPGRLSLFVGKQLLICNEFKVQVPDECKPKAKKNTETKTSRKRKYEPND